MERSFCCLKCKKTFQLNSHLKNHAKICKGFMDYIKCNDCKKVLKSKRTLKQHKIRCNPDRKYDCVKCNIYFSSYSQLTDHRRKNHKAVVCDICEKKFLFTNIRRHMKTMHSGQTHELYLKSIKDKKRQEYPCEECSKQFYDKSTLNRHKKHHMHKNENIYESEETQKLQITELKIEIEFNPDRKYNCDSSKIDRPFGCSKCKKTFKLQSHLKRHDDICKGFIDYINCNDCEKVFKSKRTLKKHKISCKPDRKYNCDKCCISLATYSELFDHRRKNHKSVIVCDICEKRFHSNNIKRHMKTMHTGQTRVLYLKNKEDKKINSFLCKECSKQFFDKSTLNRHKKQHLKKCSQCENVFRSQVHLDAHNLIHMSDNMKCSNKFTPEELKRILEVHQHLENLMLMVSDRGQ